MNPVLPPDAPSPRLASGPPAPSKSVFLQAASKSPDPVFGPRQWREIPSAPPGGWAVVSPPHPLTPMLYSGLDVCFSKRQPRSWENHPSLGCLFPPHLARCP
ncbi:forkhead box protein N1 [Platysternon megacephalum]|uniref:Forkhead box protein N1 n=1 Tax=Platysternon megacephalum TaxID=55544 RepID=A0A4D9E3L9_9SAUR|nr:forkhead box protein N1 [Platysternon megacephalum]